MQEFESYSQLVYSKPIVEFVTVANEFCLLTEQASDFEKEDFIVRSQKLLPLVYFKAAVLPAPDESTGEFYQKFVNEADWHFTEQHVAQKLGLSEIFVSITEPANKTEEQEVSLSECYADIYQDLKDFTMLYGIGDELAVNEALWELKENFEQVWGPRILVLLKELHNLIFSGELSLDSEKESLPQIDKPKSTGDDDFDQLDIKNLFKN